MRDTKAMQEISRDEQVRPGLPTDSSIKKRRFKPVFWLSCAVVILFIISLIMAAYIGSLETRIGQLDQAQVALANQQNKFNQAVGEWAAQSDSRLNVLENNK